MAIPPPPAKLPPQPYSSPPPLNLAIRPIFKFLLLTIFCSLCYIIGSYSNTTTTIPTPHSVTVPISACNSQLRTSSGKLNDTKHYLPKGQLDFASHHTMSLPIHTTDEDQNQYMGIPFPYCPRNYTDYCPCHDPNREGLFTDEKRFQKERHCPENGHQILRCLVPKPLNYRRTFPWPKSKDYAWYDNVPFKKLTEYKKKQNWVRLEGNRLFFPGGGTSFPKGIKGYIDVLNRILPLKGGSIRTVLDVGCGVASFGAYLMDYDILTMSIAPRDSHEAQVQFALERGLPAMLGVLSTHRLPFPSRSFDMVHCSRCLVPWTDYGGLYLMEIDRILRPGGYWVLSGPPISWRISNRGWERDAKELEMEQNNLEDVARKLCWKKLGERGPIAVWQKPTNHIHCAQKLKSWKTAAKFCADGDNPDNAWKKKMELCITRLPDVRNVKDTSGGSLKKWPARLKAPPPRVVESGGNPATTAQKLREDNQVWKKRVTYYGSVLKTLLFKGRYRNILDMNSGYGGFGAALGDYPVWVMNVVPFDAKIDTLGIVYERGLIGTYTDWCEPFSTYPRTYDLIHADGIFTLQANKCEIVDIILEMQRILRPEGSVIIREHVDIIVKLKAIIERKMGWKNTKLTHSEKGPSHPQKILFLDNSSPSSLL